MTTPFDFSNEPFAQAWWSAVLNDIKNDLTQFQTLCSDEPSNKSIRTTEEIDRRNRERALVRERMARLINQIDDAQARYKAAQDAIAREREQHRAALVDRKLSEFDHFIWGSRG